jgi:hypothetical protein
MEAGCRVLEPGTVYSAMADDSMFRFAIQAKCRKNPLDLRFIGKRQSASMAMLIEESLIRR